MNPYSTKALTSEEYDALEAADQAENAALCVGFAVVVVALFALRALRAGLLNVPFQDWRFRRITKNTFEDDEEPKLPDTPWF